MVFVGPPTDHTASFDMSLDITEDSYRDYNQFEFPGVVSSALPAVLHCLSIISPHTTYFTKL